MTQARWLTFFIVTMVLAGSGWSSENFTNIQAGYMDGFYLQTQDENYRIKFGARVNFGYGYGFQDDNRNLSSFELHHGKIYFGGNVFSPDVQYYFQAGSAARNANPRRLERMTESQQGALTLEDYFVRMKWQDMVVQVGQFKVPLARQWMIYSGNLQFVDRSLVSQVMHFGRDRGITLSSYQDTFWATVGVFNGSGVYLLGPRFATNTVASNDFTRGHGHLYAARIAALPYGSAGYAEGDVDFNQAQRVEIGGSFVFDHERDIGLTNPLVADETQADILIAAGDLTWKHAGKSFQGEGFYRKVYRDFAQDLTSWGFYTQLGYFIIPSEFELAGRLSWLDPTSADQDRVVDVAGVANIHFSRDHRYKLQLQYLWRNQQVAASTRHDHFIDLALQLTL